MSVTILRIGRALPPKDLAALLTRASARPAPTPQSDFLAARTQACHACPHFALVNLAERCNLAPQWGCLFRARQRQALQCLEKRWP
jgi:hypothetical protein